MVLLLRLRLRAAWNAVRFGRPMPLLVGAALALGSLALFVAIFLLFAALLTTARVAGEETLHRLIGRTALFLFLFLLAGAVPFVSSTLFAPGDLPLLLASPARPAAVVLARLLDAVVVSSAQFMVIGVPLLVASAQALRLSVAGWLAFVVILLLFLALPALATAALLLTLARIAGLRRVRGVVAVVSAALAVGMCLLMVAEFAGQASRFGRASLDVSLPGAALDLPPPPGWFPSTWATDALIAVGAGRPAKAMPPFVLLLGSVVLCGAACVALGRRVLLGETLLEDDGGGAQAARRSLLDVFLNLLPLAPSMRALLAKDLRYVLRDQVLLSQIGIPIILYLVPFVLAPQALGQGASRADLFALSAGMVATIVFMETSILSLSSVGLEGQAFWIPRAAPVTTATFVRAKFLTAFGVSLALCVPLLLLSCLVFRAPLTWTGASIGGLIVAAAALCGLGVGIAGIFPRFVYENPAHRASLAALVWGFVGATLYVVVAMALLAGAFIAAQHAPERSTALIGGAVGLFGLLSLLTGVAPLVLAVKRLEGYSGEE